MRQQFEARKKKTKPFTFDGDQFLIGKISAGQAMAYHAISEQEPKRPAMETMGVLLQAALMDAEGKPIFADGDEGLQDVMRTVPYDAFIPLFKEAAAFNRLTKEAIDEQAGN